MTDSPLLPVVMDQLEPMFDRLRQAGLAEESAAEIIGQLSGQVIAETLEDLMNAPGMSDQVLDQSISTLPPEEQLPKLAELFEQYLNQDLQELIKAKATKLVQEFALAG